jgi:hypothetical protein
MLKNACQDPMKSVPELKHFEKDLQSVSKELNASTYNNPLLYISIRKPCRQLNHSPLESGTKDHNSERG